MHYQSESILIIDDKEADRSKLFTTLTSFGFDVDIVQDGNEALDRIDEKRFALIFLASRLWGTVVSPNSYRLLSILNEKGILQSIPVVIITPPDDFPRLELLELVDRFVKMGATDYLPEPFIPEILKARVEAYVAQRKLVWLESELKNQEGLMSDVDVARQIQEDFLPESLPTLPGWDIAACFHPARDVAGDFYDAFWLSQKQRIGFVVADVCDKGVGSALFMALARSLIRQNYVTSWKSVLCDQPDNEMLWDKQVEAVKNGLKFTNTYIVENHVKLGYFVTVFFGVLDPATGMLLYVNAGHEKPFIIDKDSTIKVTLDTTAPAVGLFGDAQFKVEKVLLEPGDTLFCYTDGVPDARCSIRGPFGRENILALLQRKTYLSATILLNRFEAALMDHIATGEQFDDITMMAIRRQSDMDIAVASV